MMKRTAVVLIAVLLTACGGEDHEDIKSWMREATKDLKGRVPPLPEYRPFEPVAYEAGSLVSPFEPRKIEPEKRGTGGGLRPDPNRRREPLEAYPLESIRMVGTMAKGKDVIAIVQVDRLVHHVRTGNYMGQNFGVITKISEAEMTLKELVQDSSGDWAERLSTLQLQEK